MLTCSNDIVNNYHTLALLDGITLDLEKVLAILLLIGNRLRRTRQLALLANWDKGSAQPQRQAGTKQEASGIQTNDDLGLLVGAVGLDQMQFKGPHEQLMEFRVGEERKDVDEVDARRGEVGELAQGGAQLYFKTGEFGGGGGMGGGESCLGGGGIWGVARGVLSGEVGHGEEERKKRRGKTKMWWVWGGFYEV